MCRYIEALSARACCLTGAAAAAALFPSSSASISVSITVSPGFCASLTDLNLSGNNLGADGVAVITGRYHHRNREVAGSNPGSGGVESGGGLPSLLRLNISDTQITSLEGLECCPNLGVLVADNNRVVCLPSSFRRDPDVGGMPGGRVCPPGGGPHAALREIWLNGNRLEAVPDLWLPCLQRLHARDNRVQMIGHLGGGLYSLNPVYPWLESAWLQPSTLKPLECKTGFKVLLSNGSTCTATPGWGP